MELIAIVIGIIALGLAAVDELQRDWDQKRLQKRLNEELHERIEVRGIEDCDDPVTEGLHRSRSVSPADYRRWDHKSQ